MSNILYGIYKRRILFGVLLLSALVAPLLFHTPIAQADVGLPAWWSGKTCDTNNYPGSYQLSSSSVFDGVIACGPGPDQGGTDTAVQFTGYSFTNYEWECVELSERFLDLVYGQGPYSAPGGDDIVSNYPGSKLTQVNNNGSSLPSAGDVFSESGTQQNPYGHTGVITAVNVTNGSGTVTTMDQNNYNDGGVLKINVVNGVLQNDVSGWLHNPAATSGSTTPKVTPVQYNTEMDVFKRGSDNAIWGDTIQAGSNSWGGWHSLGGGLASNPSADQYGTEMDVFATNSAGQLYQKTYQPSSGWGGWTQRASNMAGDPASIAYNGKLYVFSRGTDGNLYVTYWNGTSWIGPNRIAGNGSTAMGSSPTVTIFGSEMDIFMRGVDSNLWKSGTTDGVNFGSLGITANVGNLENDPKAITYDGEIDVYANTTSGTLEHDTYTTTNGWSGFNPLLGASFVGSPTALQYGSGEMDVYDRGISDSYIYQNTWQAGGISWSGWTSRGGNEQGDPTVLEWTPDSEMDVYATNYANNTDKDTWQPSLNSWSSFQSLL
jgi:hypothetical protein